MIRCAGVYPVYQSSRLRVLDLTLVFTDFRVHTPAGAGSVRKRMLHSVRPSVPSIISKRVVHSVYTRMVWVVCVEYMRPSCTLKHLVATSPLSRVSTISVYGLNFIWSAANLCNRFNVTWGCSSAYLLLGCSKFLAWSNSRLTVSTFLFKSFSSSVFFFFAF